MKTFLFLIFILSHSLVYAFDWQGHRGARGLYPENTVGSMLEALKYPIKTLEFDVIVTKDKKVILSHEPWLGEEVCLSLKGTSVKEREVNLYQLTAKEIQRFDCGSRPHPRFPQQKKLKASKPLVSDVFKAVLAHSKGKDIRFNIEIKSTLEDELKGFQPEYKELSEIVISELQKLMSWEKVTIQSFDWRILKYLNEKYPKIRLVALQEESMLPEKVIKLLGFVPAIYSPYYKNLTEKIVKNWQSKGSLVVPWTVNEVTDMIRVKSLGVDGIITDYPNLIERVQ